MREKRVFAQSDGRHTGFSAFSPVEHAIGAHGLVGRATIRVGAGMIPELCGGKHTVLLA